MTIGRPKEFSRDVALERAMETFWDKGYEATSVQTLLEAMGINRGSMYDTFGDKHALFNAAFDHYIEVFSKGLDSTLDAPGSPLGNIRLVLEDFACTATDCRQRGCLITNCMVELAPHDDAVAQACRTVLRRIERGVRNTLDRAIEAGELPTDSDTRAQTRFLITTIQGMAVMGKTATGTGPMKDVIGVAMAALK